MHAPAFHPLAVHPDDYPAARVPILPLAGLGSFLALERSAIPSAFLESPWPFFPLGRHALAEALRCTGAGRESAVLLPAFHCRSMVESVLEQGAEARFYPVTADLRPDFDALGTLAEDGKVRALVSTHYFGFPNVPEEAQSFCVRHGISLIEDCAHAFYGSHQGKALGTFGRYAVASVWKFLPVRDGALLRDNAGGPWPGLRPRPWKSEAKACAALLEGGLRRALPRGSLPAVVAGEWAAQAQALAARGGGEEGVPTFQADQVGSAGLRVSRALMAGVAHGRVIRRRRGNYLRWLEGVRDLPGLRPLFPHLPEEVVPYAFPLLADAEGVLFHALKLAGIPLWRWEDMAVTDCPVSREYRIRLLQLPCHQELHTRELDWMLEVVRTVWPRLIA